MTNQFSIFVKKSGQTLTVDFDAYPVHIQQHIIEYGLKQKFNDVHSAEENGETAWGLVTNLQERLLQGDISKRGSSGNPVEMRLRAILRKLVVATAGLKGAEAAKLSLSEAAEALAKRAGKPAEAIIAHYTPIAEGQIKREREEATELLSGLDIE